MAAADVVSALHGALNSSTIHNLIDSGGNSNEPSFGFGSSAGFTFYSAHWVRQMADKAIQVYYRAGVSLRRSRDSTSVVGLCNPSCVESVISFVALTRMGHTVLVINTALPAASVQTLTAACNCRMVVNGVAGWKYDVVPLVRVEELLTMAETDGGCCSMADVVRTNEEEVAVLAHSTGTTGQPKLIPKRHEELLTALRGIPAVMHDHSFLIGSAMSWMASVHAMLFAFVRPGSPTVWTSDQPFSRAGRDALLQVRPLVAFCNPSVLFAASATPEGLDALRECSLVSSMGGVLPAHHAQRLLRAGVRLAVEYGLSEIPLSMSSAAWAGDAESWEYMSAAPSLAPHLHFRPLRDDEGSAWAGGQQLYELVVLPSFPALNRTWASGPGGAVHTGDLFVKHATQTRYRCVGRTRDEVEVCRGSEVLVLKTPLYEQVVHHAHHHLLDAALLFGDERPEPGMLLFVHAHVTYDDDMVRDAVWQTIVRQINGVMRVPLAKHMLVVLRDAAVPRTPKGSIVRAEVYLRFKDIIDAAYEL